MRISQNFPDNAEYIGSDNICGDIDEYPGSVSGERSDFLKNYLPHSIVRTDIEHINRSVWMKNYIKYRSDHTADQIANSAAGKFSGGAFFISA